MSAAYFSHRATNPTLRQCATFTDEHMAGLHRWAGVEVSQQCPSSRKRQRHGALLIALAEPECRRAASFTQEQVGEFEVHHVAHPCAGVQHQGEDGRGPDVLPQFDFTQQAAHDGTFQALWCELLAT